MALLTLLRMKPELMLTVPCTALPTSLVPMAPPASAVRSGAITRLPRGATGGSDRAGGRWAVAGGGHHHSNSSTEEASSGDEDGDRGFILVLQIIGRLTLLY